MLCCCLFSFFFSSFSTLFCCSALLSACGCRTEEAFFPVLFFFFENCSLSVLFFFLKQRKSTCCDVLELTAEALLIEKELKGQGDSGIALLEKRLFFLFARPCRWKVQSPFFFYLLVSLFLLFSVSVFTVFFFWLLLVCVTNSHKKNTASVAKGYETLRSRRTRGYFFFFSFARFVEHLWVLRFLTFSCWLFVLGTLCFSF